MFRKLVTKGQIENFSDVDYLNHLSVQMRERILKESNLETLTNLPVAELKKSILTQIEDMIMADSLVISYSDKKQLEAMILDETIGYGPLEALLNDNQISEIMVNGPNEIYIEKDGIISLSQASFKNDQHIKHIIERIIAPIGRRIDESSPMVDGRLPDGSRVNAVIPPVSIKGPVISIRKFNQNQLTMESLIDFGTLTQEMATFIQAAVKAKLNIVISGGTGSGKTTLLNILASAIPDTERIITIEDMSELKLYRSNVVGLEARPPNMEGTGRITIRQLVRNALRMRPDRIVVGEVRGEEAMDMLQAMNTGHSGSITTIHANSSIDALSRLEAMVVMNNAAISVEVVKYYMTTTLDLIIQIERVVDGSRKIVAVSEVCKNKGLAEIKDVFRYKISGIAKNGMAKGTFMATGVIPECMQKIRNLNINLTDDIFQN